MKMGNDIDSLYRNRFKGAKVPPPADSWENILGQLPQKREERELFPLWYKLTGVAAAVALIFAAYLQSPNFSSKENHVAVTSKTGKFNFNTSEVSATFNEVMRESGILLQALILQGSNKQLQGKQHNSTLAREEITEEIDIFYRGSSPGELIGGLGIVEHSENLVEDNSVEETDSAGEIFEAVAGGAKDEPKSLALKNEKFKLSTRVAPLYFDNLGKGNTLNNSFSQKEASGEVTFSYGVNVAYNISKKVNIRSGLNKVNLEYNTREVSFNDVAGVTSYGLKMMENTTLASPSNGTLSQKMGFLEIPLEVEYVLVDKKFVVGLIGGGSVLFLEEDELLLDLGGNRADLGGTRSINNLSYTTNVGLSLGYDLSKQLQLSLEPVVKFQMNTFRHSDGQNPYFIGLYSGLSYRF